MKWLPTLLVAFLLPAALAAQTAPPVEDGALSKLIETVLQQVATIHTGMPRSALQAMFTIDGGLQFPGEERYDYRRCPSIKITVKFKAAAGSKENASEWARDDDVIVEISKPYLQYPVAD